MPHQKVYQVLLVFLAYGFSATGMLPHFKSPDAVSTPHPPAPAPPDDDLMTETTAVPFNEYDDATPSGQEREERRCGLEEDPLWCLPSAEPQIEWYPWLGVLHYPLDNKRLSTPVVLVSPQLVIASALDIHNMPKVEFRKRSVVVLGRNCSDRGYRVRDYSLHPDFPRRSASSLALLQIDVEGRGGRTLLRPICGPPLGLTETKFYVAVLPDDCMSSQVEVHEVEYVPLDNCTQFYRENDLNMASLWPTHTVCGAGKGGTCVWGRGAVLMVKQGGRWHLMGFGVNGPGCGAPARFVDYGPHRAWAQRSLRRLGMPAITRMSENEMIVRMTTGIQRFGACDLEEMNTELYSDRMRFQVAGQGPWPPEQQAHYNLTLHTYIDYSCVRILVANAGKHFVDPHVEIKSYCRSPWPICYQSGMQEIILDVVILFKYMITLTVTFYGRDRPTVSSKLLLRLQNEKRAKADIPWGLREAYFKKQWYPIEP